MSTLKSKAEAILAEKESKITSENIKNGVTIFNVSGSLKGRNFYLGGGTYKKDTTDISKWSNQWKSADGMITNNHKAGDIGCAISEYELGEQRQASDFETNGNWFVYLPKTYTFESALTSDVAGSTTFQLTGSYDSVVEFHVDVDASNNYYAIYLARGSMHGNPDEYGLASSNGIDFAMKRFNTSTYKYDIDDNTGIEIQPMYSDKTLCSVKVGDSSTVFSKLKQNLPDFYNLVFGQTVVIKDNIVAEFNGTDWVEI